MITMADLERTYTIPLRRDFIKKPMHERTKRAVSEIRRFISKHMKAEDVKLGKHLNEHLWSHGIKNPPGKVKVKAVRDGNSVTVELEGFDYKVEEIQKQKAEGPKTLKEKIAASIGPKEGEKKAPEQKAAEKKEETPTETPAKEEPKGAKPPKAKRRKG